MRTQLKQPAAVSHTIQYKTKAANQAHMHAVLQKYGVGSTLAVVQRQADDELDDELLQGKFETAQLEELDDEEEPLQGKFSDTVQREESHSTKNETGIPDNMKAGFENMSGFSFDDVRVHYNSDKPAQLQALAYTQGNQVHIAPGQEKHLGHELGHVVQQKQGRVQPTMQLQGVNVNDNEGLEREADNIGERAVKINYNNFSNEEIAQRKVYGGVVQRQLWEFNKDSQIWPQYKTLEPKVKNKMNQIANTIDRYTQEGYNELQEYNSDGKLNHFNDANQNYVDNYLKDKSAAAAGYIIESIASKRSKNEFGDEITTQCLDAEGGRPDFGFFVEDCLGYVDITSSNQIGHVLYKKLSFDKIFYLAEAIYTSLSGMQRILAKPSFDNADFISNAKLSGKPKIWTRGEDKLLLEGIYFFDVDNWAAIANHVGNGRTRAQCAQRWNRDLNPDISKEAWTAEKDARLMELVDKYDNKAWAKVAAEMGNRSDVQCRYHYIQISKKSDTPQSIEACPSVLVFSNMDEVNEHPFPPLSGICNAARNIAEF